MTDRCIEQAKELKYDMKYEDMSVEAILLVLVEVSSFQEVQYVLNTTEWTTETKKLRDLIKKDKV